MELPSSVRAPRSTDDWELLMLAAPRNKSAAIVTGKRFVVYASDAQERERSEPRLASDTSYNAVALICTSISAVQMNGNSLCWFGLRERATGEARSASHTSLWRLPSRNRATAKVERWEGLMLTAPRRTSRQATFDWLAPCRI